MTTKKEFRRTQRKQTHQSGKARSSRFYRTLGRFERTVSVLGRSQSTFNNYSRHVASVSLHFGKFYRIGFRANSRLPFYLQKNQNHLHNRILNIPFTDFGFTEIGRFELRLLRVFRKLKEKNCL